jgi:hypothetical protein
MKHQAGNTLLEYSLIGSLIALGCVAGLLGAGKNFAAMISGLKTEMSAHNQLAAAASKKAAILSSTTSPSGTSSVSTLLNLTPQEQALLEQPLAEKLQTTGANGTTELLAKQLEVVAAELLAEGKITEAQSNTILSLANQGHHLAELEGMVEQAVASQQGTITMNGQTDDLHTFVSQFAFSDLGPHQFSGNTDILSSNYAAYQEPEMAKFVSLYQEVIASGAASDPLVASTIRSAATQIASIAESTEDSIFGGVQSDFNLALASRATQMNSAYICTAGNFSDNGLLCTP